MALLLCRAAQAGELPNEPILRIETGMHSGDVKDLAVDKSETFVCSRRFSNHAAHDWRESRWVRHTIKRKSFRFRRAGGSKGSKGGNMKSMADMSQQEVFERLRTILQLYAPQMVIGKDGPEDYYLDTVHTMKNKKALFFAMVTIGKSYVSYHLFPVYVCPELLEGMSDGLKARMQGKACFNFKTVDTALFEELATLTKAGCERLQSREMLDKFCGEKR
jgi:hypothetical protein